VSDPVSEVHRANSDSATSARPLRKDAADNRERLLVAAAIVFARDGVDACVEQVAREAGIGMGTVYRRFPNKAALIDELVDALLDEMIAAAETALVDESSGEHTGEGLERYLRAAATLLAQRRSFLPMVWHGSHRLPKIHQLRASTATLLARAQQHGSVSPDVTAPDITVAMWSLRGVMETSHAVAPDAWQRHLDFVLAGLRVGGIAFSTPPLTIAQMDEIVRTDG
jgi:AcrR family transcriptional regulator